MKRENGKKEKEKEMERDIKLVPSLARGGIHQHSVILSGTSLAAIRIHSSLSTINTTKAMCGVQNDWNSFRKSQRKSRQPFFLFISTTPRTRATNSRMMTIR
jgi:hypothetical protein